MYMKKNKKNASINFSVDLDENNIPEEIRWSATDNGDKVNKAKAIMLSIWDGVDNSSLKINLWTKSKSPRESFTLGYIFGFSMFGIGVNWLHISINLFGGINIYFAILITYLLIAFLSLYPAICGYISTKYFKNNLFLSLPALWFISEWARGIVLTGFPWLNIGTSQTDSILINFAPIIGDYGVTFIVCIIASCIVKIIAGGK